MEKRGKIKSKDLKEYTRVLDGVVSLMPRGPYDASLTQRKSIRSFVSYMVGKWINSTTFDGKGLDVRPEAKMEVGVVKELTWQYVIKGETLQALQRYQVRLVDEVFEILQKARDLPNANRALIPPNFLALLNEAPDEAGKMRVVIDVLATMGEDQVANIHRANSEVSWTFA